MKVKRSSVEIDKVGEYWVVRYYSSPDVVFQLKVRQYTYEWPAEFTCEIRLRESKEFTELARFDFDITYLWEDTTLTPCVCCFPEAWRDVFVALARHWANLNDITGFTPSAVMWRQGNPAFIDPLADRVNAAERMPHGAVTEQSKILARKVSIH
jgi:hypothetical protein